MLIFYYLGCIFSYLLKEIDKFKFAEDLTMGKELSEMTLEELWDLFPILLVQHDDRWYEYYKEIESTITDLLASYPVKRISHIGSTAIQGIWAKNIVDVMVEISEKADMEEVAHIFELWKRYEHNRDSYTNAKTEFIRKWTAEARMKYVDRYL